MHHPPAQDRAAWQDHFCGKSEYWASEILSSQQIVQMIEATFSADDVQNKFQAKNEPAGKKTSEKKESEAKRETVSERYCVKNSTKGVFAVLQSVLMSGKTKVAVRISVANIQKEEYMDFFS